MKVRISYLGLVALVSCAAPGPPAEYADFKPLQSQMCRNSARSRVTAIRVSMPGSADYPQAMGAGITRITTVPVEVWVTYASIDGRVLASDNFQYANPTMRDQIPRIFLGLQGALRDARLTMGGTGPDWTLKVKLERDRVPSLRYELSETSSGKSVSNIDIPLRESVTQRVPPDIPQNLRTAWMIREGMRVNIKEFIDGFPGCS